MPWRAMIFTNPNRHRPELGPFSLAAVLGAALILGIPATCRAASSFPIAESIHRLRTTLRPLDLSQPTASTPELGAYLEYYSLDLEKIDHFIGTFPSGTNTLVAQVFKPARSTATVMLAHGYYDHVGVWKRAIRRLTDEGFVVAAFDQPGHGLSSGEPAAIGSFAEYTAALQTFVSICRRDLPGPHHLVAHSLGCAAVLDCLLIHRDFPVERMVFLAPLVRSSAWSTSGLGYQLGRRVADSVPRNFRKNSSDPEFLRFHKRDPLQARTVPMRWVAAHRAWYEDIQAAQPAERPLRVLQGTKDTTVDWKHNLEFIRRKLPQAEITRIDQAGHQLMNESEPIRTEVLDLVIEYLRR